MIINPFAISTLSDEMMELKLKLKIFQILISEQRPPFTKLVSIGPKQRAVQRQSSHQVLLLLFWGK